MDPIGLWVNRQGGVFRNNVGPGKEFDAIQEIIPNREDKVLEKVLERFSRGMEPEGKCDSITSVLSGVEGNSE